MERVDGLVFGVPPSGGPGLRKRGTRNGEPDRNLRLSQFTGERRSRSVNAAPVASGVVLGLEPVGVTVEKEIVAAAGAMPVGSYAARQVAAHGFLVRGGEMRRGPYIEQVEHGRFLNILNPFLYKLGIFGLQMISKIK